jgi:hypothetical protein
MADTRIAKDKKPSSFLLHPDARPATFHSSSKSTPKEGIVRPISVVITAG